ncbi:MAG: DNA-directed RNA polymerase subunit K [Nanobdellota archaeon]
MASEAETKKHISQEEFGKYELARVIGSRAMQISQGAEPLIKLTEKQLENINYNPIEIAKLEMKEGVLPINIVRPNPSQK